MTLTSYLIMVYLVGFVFAAILILVEALRENKKIFGEYIIEKDDWELLLRIVWFSWITVIVLFTADKK